MGSLSAMLDIQETILPGVLLLSPRRFSDPRGFFCETWNLERYSAAGLDYNWVQDNQSVSVSVGTLRGLHYQKPPRAQDKLVRCGRGRLFDVAVDVRRGSPTYGDWVGIELSAENGFQMLIPAGFLHGFVTREPDTEIIYKCSDYYAPDCDGAVHWDSCGINWGLDRAPLMSEKDAIAVPFSEFQSPFLWEEAP